jgi:Cu+-exporting ATPase
MNEKQNAPTQREINGKPNNPKLKTDRRQEMAVDPVCKMKVEPETAAAEAEYKGKTYYFCAPGCKVAFEKNPEKYLKEGEEQEGGH